MCVPYRQEMTNLVYVFDHELEIWSTSITISDQFY